ncbi:hypothetical protein BSKO_07210 [Bryopsis sp. KO-2023]|nr:hypothetical protein BSKO_07210 [Bryopsis sp. KO-2023]
MEVESGTQLREKALRLIGELKESEEVGHKREVMKELMLLDVERVPYSAEDILHEVVALQHDQETIEVKGDLLQFLRKMLSVGIGWEVLCPTLDWLSGMVSAREPPVIIKIIQSCPKLTRSILTQALEKGGEAGLSNGWKTAWESNVLFLHTLVETSMDLLDGPIIMYAAKLMEQCVLTFTNPSESAVPGLEHHVPIPSNHPVFNSVKLHAQSQRFVQKLVDRCTPESMSNMRGTSQIAILKALGSIARLRAVFSGRIVPALLDLATSGKYHVASKGAGSVSVDGVTASVSTALREALLGALKNRDSTAQVWRKRLVDGLKKVGAGVAAEHIVKQIDRHTEKEKRARRGDKFISDEVSVPKRVKREGGAKPPSHAEDKRHNSAQRPNLPCRDADQSNMGVRMVPDETVTAIQSTGNSPEPASNGTVDLSRLPASQPPSMSRVEPKESGPRAREAGREGEKDPRAPRAKAMGNPLLKGKLDVNQVRSILGLLASIGQKKLLQGFVKNLDVRILADVVIANLKELPPRTDTASECSTPKPTEPASDGPTASGDIPGHEDSNQERVQEVNDAPETASVPNDGGEQEQEGGPEADIPDVWQAESQLPSPHEHQDEATVSVQEKATDEAGTASIQIGGAEIPTVDVEEADTGVQTQTEDTDNAMQLGERGKERVECSEGSVREIEKSTPIVRDAEADAGEGPSGDAHQVDSKMDVVDEKEYGEEEDAKEVDGDAHFEVDDGDDGDDLTRLALRPRALTEGQRTALVKQGVLPLIAANSVTNRHAVFCQGVLARLASSGRIGQSPVDAVLTHIVANFSGMAAQELAVKWLYSVFLDHGAPSLDRLQVPSATNLHQSWKEFDEEGTGPKGGVGPYEEAFSVLLRRLSMRIEAREKSITALLIEAPALPPVPVCRFLMTLCKRGSQFATLALTTANTIMDARPPLRETMLNVILEVTTCRDEDSRDQAIRLVKNKLYSKEEFSAKIEAFAVASLERLKAAGKESDQSEEAADHKGTVGGGIDLMEAEERMEDWGRYCSLYMALCIRRKSLLRGLMEAYGCTNAGGQDAIFRNAPKLADAIGYSSPEMLELIRDTPPGADKLLLSMLTVMPKRIASAAVAVVVQACQERFRAKDDIRFIVPALPGMPKREALNMVPRLARLPLQEFSAAIQSLISRASSMDESIEPSEVLVALNMANLQEQNVRLVQLRAALDHCLRKLADVFDREALAGALNKMVQLPNLPILFMRMVLVSVGREESLCAFVLGTLLSSSVVIEKILNEKNQWRGYLMLMAQTVPYSYKHLIELPSKVMKAVLKESSEDFVVKFRNFAESDHEIRIAAETMATLKSLSEGGTGEEPCQATGANSGGASSQQTHTTKGDGKEGGGNEDVGGSNDVAGDSGGGGGDSPMTEGNGLAENNDKMEE